MFDAMALMLALRSTGGMGKIPCNGPSTIAFILVLLMAACNEEEPDLVHQSQINRWKFLNYDGGLASDHVNEIFEDSQGRLWFGTDRGLSMLSNNQLMTYSIGHGLLDTNIFAITEDRDGNIWVGTPRGVNIFVEDRWQYFPFFYQAPVYDIIALQDDEGMLVGTGGFGVYKYDYETSAFSRFDVIRQCRACNSINSMFQAKDKSIWIASSNGARRIRDTFVTQFDVKDGLAGTIATTITEDSWGNIWIGSFEGRTISRVHGNTISQVSFNNGEEQNFIFGIQEDNDGNLWVGTVGNGLFFFDGAIMKEVVDGPKDKTITALYKDRKGNIWVGTSGEGVAQYVVNPN